MRRSGLAAFISAVLLVVACSEQPTAPSERQNPSPEAPAFLAVCSASTPSCIQSLINALFRPGDNLESANSFWTNIQTKFNQGLKGRAAAQAKATELVNFGLKNFYANKLLGGMSQGTIDNLVALNDAVYGYTLMLDPPTIPPEALGPDAAAVILGPQSPTTLVITETKQAGVIVPAGAARQTTLVSINRLPDSPGPLLTSLDQFPLFYQFATTPEIEFGQSVTTGVCQSQDFEPYGALRLAHNVGPNFGDIEILPRVAAPFLDCSNVSGPIGALEGSGLTGFASAGWRLLGRTVGPVAKAIFLPDELHAVALGTCCLGGSGSKFSPHGAVNPNSNPGSLSIVDQNGNPASGAVSGPGTVYVKASSNNEAPIQKVPVTFGETTVLTNASGIASFVWDATPGTTLTATVPDETDEEAPSSCPSDIPEPTPNTKYRPFVCFTPHSVTFTTNTLLDYGSGGYTFILIGSNAPSGGTPTYPGESWFSRSFAPGEAWSTGPAPFGYPSAGCSIYTSHPVATPWAAADGSKADPSTGSGLLLRKEFKTPTGFNGSVSVNVAIDNDIQVYLDGHDVTNAEGVTFSAHTNTDAVNGFWFGYVGPFQAHGGCAQQGDGTFTVPRSHLDVGDQHLLAVYAHDWGGASYADMQAKLEISE